MIIGALRLTFALYGCASLKDKRSIVKRLINQVQQKFPVSAAEVGANDNLRQAQIGLSIVTNDAAHANEVLDKIINFADNPGTAQLVDQEMEIIPMGTLIGPNPRAAQ